MRPFLSSGILARRRVVFVAALSAFALSAGVACDAFAPSRSDAAKLVMQLVLPRGGIASATAAFKADVSVSGPGIATPITGTFFFDTSGTATATMTIPVGTPRILTISIFDASSVLLFMGTDTISVLPGVNPPATVRITPTTGSVPITVIVGSYIVSVSPTSATVAVGATRAFAATVLNPGGTPSSTPAKWATANPAIVQIDSVTGVATGRIAGTSSITATALGVAATAAVTVTVP